MAHRRLTVKEREALEDIVVDADAWWDHVNTYYADPNSRMIEPEKALADKLARWKPDLDKRKAVGKYKNRAARDAERKAEPPAVVISAEDREVMERGMEPEEVDNWAAAKSQSGSLEGAMVELAKLPRK